MWIPVPPSAEAALAGATVLLNLSGSPITIARAEDRKLLCRSASLALPGGLRLRRGRAGRVDDRPVVGRPDDGLRERRAARRERPLRRRRPADDRRRRRRPPAPGAHADGDVRRQPAHARRARRRVPHDRLHPRPARRGPRPPARGRALPVRPVRPRPPQPRLLRGLQHPGRRPAAAAARDRRPEGRHRRLGRPRLDARADRRRAGDGPLRAPAQRHPRVHAPGLRDERRDEGERAPADARARRDRRRSSTSGRPPS